MADIEQLLKILKDLIESEPTNRLRKIREFFNQNQTRIYECDQKGKNVFHVIATGAEKNPEIFNIFLPNREESLACVQTIEQLFRSKDEGGQGRTPLHIAAQSGFASFVKEILQLCPSLITSKDQHYNTPLHMAAMSSSPDAAECVALILAVAEEKNLTEDVLMKIKNNQGQTPIHAMCSKVPDNEDAGVKAKMTLLLKFECTNNILMTVDDSKFSPLHSLCTKKKHSGVDAKESKNLIDLVEVLIHNREGVNFVTDDEHKRTALHLACISEYPKVTEVLARHAGVDVTLRDGHGKMAIHYTAEKSTRPASRKCTMALADWSILEPKMKQHGQGLEPQDRFRNYLLWDTDMKSQEMNLVDTEKLYLVRETSSSKVGNTALTLACKAKSTKTVEHILRNVYKAKRNFDTWFIGKDKNPDVFSLKQVYKHTPEALEFLLDESINIDMKNSDERRIEFTTNISIITALARPLLREKSVSEVTYLNYQRSWPEAVREKILLHSLTKCVLVAAWQRMFVYKIFWIVFNIVWLASYFLLVPYNYSEEEKRYKTYQTVAAWILAMFTFAYIINEVLEIIISGFGSYAKLLRTRKIIMYWGQILLTAIAVFNPCLALQEPSTVEKYCASAGVALSFLLFWRNLGIINLRLGIQVEYLLQTLMKIAAAFMCCLPIILGFERAFRQIIPEHFVSGSIWAFTKTLVMMSGEFEYTSMFEGYGASEDGKNNTMVQDVKMVEAASQTLKLVAFILFFIMLPVAFYNLITGLVVDKVKSMEQRLEMHEISNHIHVINYVQRTMISKFQFLAHCGLLKLCFASYQSNPTGEVELDQKLKWYIEKDAKSSSSYLSTLSWNRLCPDRSGALCGNFLPVAVKRKFFDLYEKQVADDE